MARNFQREAIDGGDTGIWATPELSQNRLSLGINTIKCYDDSGTLKATVGKCGLITDSIYGVCHNTAVETVSLAAVTNGNWFKVEIQRNGANFNFVASDTNTGTDDDPGVLPSGLLAAYDHEKGGYYYNSNYRTIAVGWVNSGGTLEGIIILGNHTRGEGYSLTDDALDQVYRWEFGNNDTFDDNYIGRLYLLEESERPNSWILNGGNAVAFTDVDFSAYVPTGVKALVLQYIFQFTGNGALDSVVAQLRQNGSAESDIIRTRILDIGYTNLGVGIILRGSGIITVLCDSDGIVEYLVTNAAADLYLTIRGYYLEDNVA